MEESERVKTERIILDTYWESIPAAKSLDINNYDFHPIRSNILRILYDGLLEEETEEVKKKRHVLNASEILDELNKRIDSGKLLDSKKGKREVLIKPISITNLYFHLNKLIDIGVIVVVTELLEGPHNRNKTKYYGRIARHLFISDEAESLLKYKRRFKAFKRLAEAIGLTLPEDYEEFPIRYLNIKKNRYKAIENWFVKHEKTIYEISEQQQDFGEIYEFLKDMDSHFSSKYIDISSDFVELIQQELE